MKSPRTSRLLRAPLLLAFTFAFTQNCTPPKGWKGVYHSYSGGYSSYRQGGNFGRYGGSSKRNSIVRLARKYLGVPYKFGGKSPRGFDCSGLTNYVYKKAAGISLPRTSRAQAKQGRKVRVPKPGDLIFFNTSGRASHVGIYIGRGSFIHAPRRGKNVEISSMKNSYWRKHYLFSKTLI